MTGAPLVAGRVYGLRTWRVAVVDGAERLTGPYQETPWPDEGLPLEAACDEDPSHEAPAAGCGCGAHGWHPRRATARKVLGYRGLVPGVVEAWGAVEVHRDGFRAQWARPYALVLLPGRYAKQIRRLAAAHCADVIEVRRPDDLLAVCRERRFGLPEPVVADLLGPAFEVPRPKWPWRRWLGLGGPQLQG